MRRVAGGGDGIVAKEFSEGRERGIGREVGVEYSRRGTQVQLVEGTVEVQVVESYKIRKRPVYPRCPSPLFAAPRFRKREGWPASPDASLSIAASKAHFCLIS